MLTDSGMQIAPSTYYAAIARLPSARAVRDEQLKKDIFRVYENYSVYRGGKGVVGAEPGGDRGGPVPGGTADAGSGTGRHSAG